MENIKNIDNNIDDCTKTADNFKPHRKYKIQKMSRSFLNVIERKKPIVEKCFICGKKRDEVELEKFAINKDICAECKKWYNDKLNE